ncbi:MAG: MATE family efflux transporter [Bacteroidales bacterium]
MKNSKHGYLLHKFRLFSKNIGEAIAGTDKDFTEVTLGKAIFLLSVPSVLEMIMESVFAVVDMFFVSRLGSDAVATVGLTESLITIVYAISFGLATATTSMVSRRVGEKNPGKAAETAFQAIITGAAVSLIIAIPGAIYSARLLHIMGASETVTTQYAGYARIMLGGNLVIVLLYIINAIFRSAGDAAVAMRVLWVGNIINIILDPCFIFGIGPFPELGVIGAAVATTIGRGIAVLYQFWLLFFGKKRIRLSLGRMRINFRIMARLLKISLGSTGQNLIGTTSWIALVRIISIFGSDVVAGYTIAIRIVNFVLLPSWGLSNAASTLVGQNLGAGKPERAERSVMFTGWVNMILLGMISFVLVAFPEFFIRLFINDPRVVMPGIDCLRIISYGFVAYGFGMVMVNSFNGAGDTTTPLKINIFAYWIIEIPLAWLLALKLGMNEQGVYVAIFIAETIMTLTAWLVFRRGRWKLKTV